MRFAPLFVLLLVTTLPACSAQGNESTEASTGKHANVTNVEVRGDIGDYTFEVTVRSPDTGCDQYANWWEVVTPSGNALIYRRILAHSHPDEQPFTRSGGPVPIAPDSTVIVRAHMNDTGNGGQAMRGSPGGGFQPTDLPDGFGAEIEEASPDCGF